jgi:hypothetical protein
VKYLRPHVAGEHDVQVVCDPGRTKAEQRGRPLNARRPKLRFKKVTASVTLILLWETGLILNAQSIPSRCRGPHR